tara:strand:- start:58 stop:441 length:384 start_codon:yes stop_codon:yes gene_type:complete
MKVIKKIKLYSPDKSQCITILTGIKYRYVIAGDYDKVPKRNYVKLNADELGVIGDIFYGCWNKDGFKWELYSYMADIIENKLDTKIYRFGEKYPKDFLLKETSCFEFNYIEPTLKDKYKKMVTIEVD